MRGFKTLLSWQLHSLFVSASTYFTIFLFLVLTGAFYLLALIDVSKAPSEISPTASFLSVFWFPVLFMVPLITMRSLAEERRQGTLGAMMTTHVSAWQVVLAKFFAAYFLYVFMWLLTLSFPLVTAWTLPGATSDSKLFSIPEIVSGYGFVFLSGTTYIAIGIFASSLTRTTLVAGMLSTGMLFFAIAGAALIAKIPVTGNWYVDWIAAHGGYLQTFRQLEEFRSALLDTRPLFLYLSATAVIISVTSLITEAKKS